MYVSISRVKILHSHICDGTIVTVVQQAIL